MPSNSHFELGAENIPPPTRLAARDGLNPSTFCTVCQGRGRRGKGCAQVKIVSWTDLSRCHGAQDVEEDEGTVGGVVAHEVAMGEPSQEGERLKGQLSNHTAIKAVRRRREVCMSLGQPHHVVVKCVRVGECEGGRIGLTWY